MAKSLWSEICSQDNFYQAWQKVRANLGAPGIDKVTVLDFEANLEENLDLLLETVRLENYEPLPLLSFKKKKESGKLRELKIPTVRDRLVQEAIHLKIQPIFEKIFLDCSYAYRPRKSALKAVDRVERNVKRGRVWIFDADIEKFFDNIDRKILLEKLGEKIAEKKLLKLISRIIQSDNSAEGEGIPQGVIISPLLSNVYLHSFDDMMNRNQWNYLRYSDNLVVLCHSKEEAENAHKKAEDFLSQNLGLKFNAEKTRVLHAKDGFVFLGYHFDLKGKRPAEAAVGRMQERLKKAMSAAGQLTEAELKLKLDSIVRGWMNYFQIEEKDYGRLYEELNEKWKADEKQIANTILLVALAISLKKRDEAEKILSETAVEDFQDADLYFQWGILCELLGKKPEAIDAYHAAFRLNSGHADTAFRLGIYFLNEQNYEKALRFFQKAIQIKPDWAQAQYVLAMTLEKYHLNGAAKKAYARAYQLDPSLKKIKRPPLPSKRKPQPAKFDFTKDDLEIFLQLLSGREGVFARQWSDQTGKVGYSPLYRALKTSDIANHLTGKETLGFYLLRSDNTVSQIVIDIDVAKTIRQEFSDATSDMKKWEDMAHLEAVAIQRLAGKLELQCYIENSGFKGRHVWFFMAEPIAAKDGISFVKKLMAQKGRMPPGLSWEIFPKEPRVGPKGLGSLVKMPLGIHKLTGNRCLFLQPDGEPFSDQWYVIQNIKKINRSQLQAALDKLSNQQIDLDKGDVDTSEIELMIGKCNVLKYLVEKAEKEHHLAHVDRLTLLHTIGHFGKAGDYMIHQIIKHTFNYDYRITERWVKRLKGSPVSCPKIREWQSHITPSVGCFCKFPAEAKCYPTPILHAKPDFVPSRKKMAAKQPDTKKPQQKVHTEKDSLYKPSAAIVDEQISKADDSIQKEPQSIDMDVEKLITNYLDLNSRFKEISKQKKTIEKQLEDIFNQKGVDRLEFRMGVLRRVKEGEQIKWIIEI